MARTIEQIREEVIGKPQTFSNLAFKIEREADIDIDARTVKLAFASDKPIDNWWYGQIKLNMAKESVRTGRLDSGAPLLMDHNTRDQIGVIETYSFDKDGVARAVVRFGSSDRAKEIFEDVRTGIRQNVSVGFMIWDLQLESQTNGATVYRADDWEPTEISIVACPADISVGVGRDLPSFTKVPDESRAITAEKEEKKMVPEEKAAVEVAQKETRSADLLIADEIREWGDAFGQQELASTYLRENLQDNGTFTGTKAGFFARVKAAQPVAPKVPASDPGVQAVREGGVDAQAIQLARSLPRHGSLKAFKGGEGAERAYRFGQWLFGRALFDPDNAVSVKARQFCDEHGLTRAMSEGTNESGGYTVPVEFSNDLIDLREQYGVFRRNANVQPMMSDTFLQPRRVSGLTAYFTAEAGAISTSDLGWDQVSLVAKKLAALARYSSEVSEDSMIDFGDTLANEIAYAFAEKEDQCGFNGDGTSTYGSITGVREKLKGLSGTIANIAGLQVGSGNAYSELTLADFEGVVARLPQYADGEGAAWFVHRSFYWNVMVKVMLAAGGVTAAEIEDARKQRYMGYRVEFSQVMPKAEGNSQVCALLGDLSKAATMGVRRDVQVAYSEHSRFANDEIEIKGTERFDINVHSVGNADSTAANQVPGPIVGLITAAS